MLNVAEQSRVGNLVALEVDSEAVDTQRQLPLAQWDPAVRSMDLLGDLVDSEAVSVVVSRVEEDEADSEVVVASRTEEAMAVVEEVLATKEVVDFHPEEDTVAEIAVGMEDPTDTEHPQMPQLVQVGEVEAATAGEALVVPVLQIATVLACQRQVVGMTRVVAVAHMMTDPADIVAVEATMTVMGLVAVAAIWSR
jgi:hypothetical protein